MDVQVHEHSLPDLFDSRSSEAGISDAAATNSIFPPNGTIAMHVHTFQLYLEQMDTFYDHMHTIDALCFVVEPTVVTTKSKSRTFKIGESSLQPTPPT